MADDYYSGDYESDGGSTEDLMADVDQGAVEGADVDQGSACSVEAEEDQLRELKEMMQDLQNGFTTVLTEVSKIQGEDQHLHEKLETSKRHQNTQINDIYDVVQQLKIQCNDIQHQIQLSNRNQRKLEKQIKKLKAQRLGPMRHSTAAPLDSLCSSFSHTEESPMLKSFIANLPSPEEMEEVEDHHSDSDQSLAAVTQKSFNLSEALAQKAVSNQDRLSSQTHLAPPDSSDRSSQQSSTGAHPADTDSRFKSDQNSANRNKMHRYSIVQSLVESERIYCTTLFSMLESNDRSAVTNISAPTNHSGVFPQSLPQIYHHHCNILRLMEHRLTRWKQQDIVGDLFAKFTATKGHIDIFSYYKDYIANISTALRNIHKKTLSGNSPRSHRGDKAGADRLSLINHLLAPVRRIPNYVLYIKKLLKYTEPDHPDRYFLDTSLSAFKSTLETMNEVMERTVHHTSLGNATSRSIDTCSLSSHEEDQRLSTATKDSGIHSTYDLDSHEELSPPPYQRREDNYLSRAKSSSIKRSYTDRTSGHDTSILKADLPQRPRSVVDFIGPNNYSSLPHRSQTPNPPYSRISLNTNGDGDDTPTGSTRLGRTNISHSTPDLLDDDYSESKKSPTKHKTKHKVQFKNPPEEPISRGRHKKRSITDTLRIFFNKKRGQKTASTSDLSDTCSEFTASTDEVPKPAPPDMFANKSGSLQYGSLGNITLTETYEDENGDPYSVV